MADAPSPSKHEVILLESNLRAANEKILSLQDQIQILQNNFSNTSSSVSAVNAFTSKVENFERSLAKHERNLDSVRQNFSELASKNRLEKLEVEQTSHSAFKNFESSLSSTVNHLQEQMLANENNLKASLTSRILQIEENVADRVEGFGSAASKIRQDFKGQLAGLSNKFEEKIYKLQSGVQQEKSKMGNLFTQQEIATREIERVVKKGQKEFEGLLFAEITKGGGWELRTSNIIIG